MRDPHFDDSKCLYSTNTVIEHYNMSPREYYNLENFTCISKNIKYQKNKENTQNLIQKIIIVIGIGFLKKKPF
jgi:hypothetical protein